jgi:hypothetical protein
MFETYELSRRAPRLRANRLTLCLSAVLLSQLSAELALATSPAAALSHSAAEHRAAPRKHNPSITATPPWTVKNCSDHDPDSLRDIIHNQVQSGDTVDLSLLPTLCGMTDSTITLTSGEIVVAADDLTLIGPDSANGTVTLSGGGAYRVFHHQGVGTLSVDSLTVTDGYYHFAGLAYGGCIESDNGNIYLNRTLVTGCTALSDTASAGGGGVSALGDVTLVLSTISENQANATSAAAFGGGIFASGSLTAKYSSISNNAEHDGPGKAGAGGGAFAGTTTIRASTIDNNSAAYSSALDILVGSLTISDSTISDNVASAIGAIYCFNCITATVANSTIAFNHQTSSSTASGAFVFYGLFANSALTLQSSIIADNTAGAGNVPADLYITIGHGVLSGTGADNLVLASNIVSPPPGVITVTTDPKLGPLQFNGGRTRTRALLPGSPALGVGNNNASLSNDQRGAGYPRTTGPMQTVDIGAFQFDSIFADAFDSQ